MGCVDCNFCNNCMAMARVSVLVCLKWCQSAQACRWGYIKTAISKNEHIWAYLLTSTWVLNSWVLFTQRILLRRLHSHRTRCKVSKRKLLDYERLYDATNNTVCTVRVLCLVGKVTCTQSDFLCLQMDYNINSFLPASCEVIFIVN